MLCGRPSVWPTSWLDTNRINWPMIESANAVPRTDGLTAAVWIRNQSRSRFCTLWYQPMSLSRISPLRGSTTLGP